MCKHIDSLYRIGNGFQFTVDIRTQEEPFWISGRVYVILSNNGHPRDVSRKSVSRAWATALPHTQCIKHWMFQQFRLQSTYDCDILGSRRDLSRIASGQNSESSLTDPGILSHFILFYLFVILKSLSSSHINTKIHI